MRTPYLTGVYLSRLYLGTPLFSRYILLYSLLSCNHVYRMTLYSCCVTVSHDCSAVIVLLCDFALDFVWLRLHTRFGVSLLVKILESLGKGRLQCPDNCGYRGLPTGPLLLYILLLAVL